MPQRHPDAFALGERVRAHRLARGWSQEYLAEAAGLHRTAVGHIERGEKDLRLSTIKRVAAALGVPASDLVAD